MCKSCQNVIDFILRKCYNIFNDICKVLFYVFLHKYIIYDRC
uniref:Uncharacterized protein n=1 Tax=Siphoviridae sp. ct5jB2 TaxID=2825337 RepID=A0A8S5TTL0_9CAUD|nr:MAG TPA: hypothetical protein [Siphoviridae sp. ct5jB2]